MTDNLNEQATADSGTDTITEASAERAHDASTHTTVRVTTHLNNAEVRGVLDPALLARPITLAHGKRCNDAQWQNKPGTLVDALNVLTTFEVGIKDGHCILQGALVADGERKSTAQCVNYFVMLDDDTGAPIEETAAEIERQNQFAVIYTTHSNMKPTTDVHRDTLVTWMRKKDRRGEPTAKDAGEYLHATKNTRLAVFEGATLDKPRQESGGVYQLLRHKPMVRKRIVLLLEQPFVFAERDGLHKDAMTEWRERYAGAAQRTGVNYDPKCVDPARLMYTPRVAPDADLSAHKIIVIAGKPLDLESVERVSAKTKKPEASNPFTEAARRAGVDGGAEPAGEFKTANMLRFAKVAAASFEYADWLEASIPDISARCPWHEAHTATTGKDTGFRAWNASDNENGFNGQCSHSCGSDPERGQGANGKQDRLKYLDAQCEALGIADAAELLDWCDPDVKVAWEAQDQEQAESGKSHARTHTQLWNDLGWAAKVHWRNRAAATGIEFETVTGLPFPPRPVKAPTATREEHDKVVAAWEVTFTKEQTAAYEDQVARWYKKEYDAGRGASRPAAVVETDYVMMRDMEEEVLTWLIPGWMPLKNLTLAMGRTKIGKSQFAVWLAACLSQGLPVFPGSEAHPPIGVAIITAGEDGHNDVLLPRLKAAGAHPDRVFVVKGTKATHADGSVVEERFCLAKTLEQLRPLLLAHPEIKLVILDPLNVFVPGKVDNSKNNQMTEQLMPLWELAQEFRCAVLVNHHMKKGEKGGNDVTDMSGGSNAIVERVRSIIGLAREPGDNGRFIVELVAGNNTGRNGEAFLYTIETAHSGMQATSKFVLGEKSEMSIAEALGGATAGEDRNKIDDARQWLAGELADGAEHLQDDLRTAAKEAGHSWSYAVREAARKLRVVKRKSGFGEDAPWVWSLPVSTAGTAVREVAIHKAEAVLAGRAA